MEGLLRTRVLPLGAPCCLVSSTGCTPPRWAPHGPGNRTQTWSFVFAPHAAHLGPPCRGQVHDGPTGKAAPRGRHLPRQPLHLLGTLRVHRQGAALIGRADGRGPQLASWFPVVARTRSQPALRPISAFPTRPSPYSHAAWSHRGADPAHVHPRLRNSLMRSGSGRSRKRPWCAATS